MIDSGTRRVPWLTSKMSDPTDFQSEPDFSDVPEYHGSKIGPQRDALALAKIRAADAKDRKQETAKLGERHGGTLADVVIALDRIEKRIASIRDVGGLIAIGFWVGAGSLLLGCTVAALYWLIIVLFLGDL